MYKIKPNMPPLRDAEDQSAITRAIFNCEGLSGSDAIIDEYEAALCKTFGVQNAIAVSSGTAAIYAVLRNLDLRPGDEVMVPAIAATMTVQPILECGAQPIFIDSQKDSFALDVNMVKRLYSDHTKAVITVPMWGYPVTSPGLKSFCKEKSLTLLVDTAQGVGTIEQGLQAGASKDVIGCFSTHENKFLSTGEGGFILLNDTEKADDIRTFVRAGNRKGSAVKTFNHEPGFNLKLNGLAAGLGLSQLKKLPLTLEARRNNGVAWINTLGQVAPELEPFSPSSGNDIPCYYSAIFLLPNNVSLTAKDLAARLSKAGIDTAVHKYDIELMPDCPVFANAYQMQSSQPTKDAFPHASNLLERVVILPTHRGITPEVIAWASEKIAACCAGDNTAVPRLETPNLG